MELTASNATSWCIVSVYRPDMLEAARRALQTHQDVRMTVDRRVGERRSPERAASAESRASNRRRVAIDDILKTYGYAIVPRGDGS
jgi:hypothetical protein